ncbi:hypothetical protein [Pelagibacterium sp.]|uniref:hypothetical protein n=1 Tax=Pelagibacterium sp. TaxID=1967288 RepID=UPI003A93C34D
MTFDAKTARNWSSLNHQMALAERHFGPAGEAMIARWLCKEIERCNDPEFSRLFSDYIVLDGIVQADYNHRLVRSRHGEMLAGIRFYRRNVAHPFIEVIAHSFSDLNALKGAVASEWSSFTPAHLRLTAPAQSLPTRDALLDISIHFASYAEMAETGLAPVDLARWDQVEAAATKARDVYDELFQDNPELDQAIDAAQFSDLESCRQAGGLYAICPGLGDLFAGILAVRPASIDWIEGDEIVEEFILPQLRGKGLAARAQHTLALERQARKTALIGTIDRRNGASRQTAIHAGRPERLRKVFLPLDQP